MIEDLWRPQLLGEFPHTPHYDVRKAAPSYSNLAAVQAGFALAAVVLIASTIGIANTSTVVKFYRDWATSFFLLAFFGSILSALLLGVIAGEEILSPRTNMIALFGAIGFSVSTSLELWGLVELVKIYLDTNVLQVARWTFIIFSCIQPLYMTFIAVDNIFLFWDRFHTALFKHHPDPHPRPHEWCLVIICGYLPLIIALFVRLTFFPCIMLDCS